MPDPQPSAASPSSKTLVLTSADLASAAPPQVPDHEMLRRVGEGAYGEVWLARNVMGTYRAVKIVYRSSFSDDRPYEREFAGIKNFEPISRAHVSQVDILHVGRNDTEGYFYYVMELADDAALDSGSSMPDSGCPASSIPHPEAYVPKTLKLDLTRRGRLPFDECLDLALALTTALEHLHQNGLMHRDIKPANIIFVNGQPKLADIGLVADVDATKSFVGTEGYIPPEGPTSPQADIYGLGKVLYEAATGRDRQDFPELPTNLGTAAEQARLVELNEVILKACANDTKHRYPNASEMNGDLLMLKANRSIKASRKLERRLALITRLCLAAIALTLLIAGSYYWVSERRAAKLHQETQFQKKENEQLNQLLSVIDPDGHMRRYAEEVKRQAAEDVKLRLPVVCSLSGGKLKALAQFAPHENSFAVVSAGGAILISDMAGKILRELSQPDERVSSIAYASDGRSIMGGTRSGKVFVWDLGSGAARMLFEKQGAPVSRVAWLANPNRGIAFLDKTGQEQSKYVQEIKTNPSGLVFDISSGRLLWSFFSFGRADFQALSASPDGKFVAMEEIPDMEPGIYLLDAASGKSVGKLFDEERTPLSVCVAPNSRTVAVGYAPYFLALWDSSTQKERLIEGHSNWVVSLAFSPDGKKLASGAGDSSARVWDVESGKELGRIRFDGQSTYVYSVSFSPDGSMLLAATAGKTIVVQTPK